jgi:Secretion system C-terminal sorting domain
VLYSLRKHYLKIKKICSVFKFAFKSVIKIKGILNFVSKHYQKFYPNYPIPIIMKKLLLSVIFLCIAIISFSQTVDILANPSTFSLAALGTNRNYNVNESIYTDVEIGNTNFTSVGTAINKIGFYAASIGALTNFGNVQIYMKEVPSGTTTFASGIYSTTGYTLVFSGSVVVGNTGLIEIPLATAFVRNAGNNLQILVERTDNVAHAGFTWRTSDGNNLGNTNLSTRYYFSNTTLPVSGTTNLTADYGRAQIRLRHAADNDASVIQVFSLGKLPLANSTPHTVSAVITNKGALTINALPVTLTVSGTNSFTNVQVISSLAPNASTTINFASYTPTVVGTDNINVSVPTDDDNSNNSKIVTQIVNNNTWSYAQGNVPTGTAGFAGNTIDLVQKFYNSSATNLAQVVAYFTTAAQPYKIGVWDATGAGGTPGALLYETSVQSSIAGVNVQPILPALALPVGNFYIGARQTNSTTFGLSRQTENPTRTGTFYYKLGGANPWVDNATGSTNVFMLEPKLQLPIDAFVSNIVVPNNGGITCATTSETISAKLTNTGSSIITAGAATLTLKITGANAQTLTTNNLTSIVSGGNEIVNFSGVNLSNAGANYDTVYVNLAGDIEQANDTTKTSFTTALRTVALETVASTYPLTANCEDMGWTYYSDVSNKNVLAVEWGTNTAAKASATATLTLDAADYTTTAGSGAGATGTFTMKRYWNIATGTQPSTPVNVRFFYDAAEKAATDAAAVSFQTANAGSSLEIPKWFKTTSGAFVGDAAHVTNSGVLNAIFLADANTGAATINGVLYAQFNGITSFSGGGYASGVGSNTVLPIGIQYIKGAKQAGGHLIDWKISCTAGVSLTLTLERSADGRNFVAIQTQVANDTRCLQPFNYIDAAALAGTNYYRIKITTVDGEVKYSTIVVLLNKEKGFELISVAPNPVKDNAVLTITSAKAGKIELLISDVAGKIIEKQLHNVIAGNNAIKIDAENIGAGTYSITAINADAEQKTIRFVKR